MRVGKDPETFSNARVQDPLQALEPEAEHLKEGVRVTPTTSNLAPYKGPTGDRIRDELP